MEERVFTIQQVGAKESPDRKRADDIYEFIIVPAVKETGLEPYRADLDLTPGAITPKMLSELLNARVVIADLTGRNPNVFYELGIIHSFERPLISIADSAASLPFDAKDERIIELGDYPPDGLSMRQGQRAIASLSESLKIVLAESYTPRSPLREVAANRSVDQLAPENPLAAEMAQMRKTLEDIWQRMTLERNGPEKYVRAISSLEQDRDRLERRVDDLRAFEREYRRRLEAYLEAQLRDLQDVQESSDNVSETEELERRIDDLRAFEREYRRRLEAYLEGQLVDIRGLDAPSLR
jgi:hypothetical protein